MKEKSPQFAFEDLEVYKVAREFRKAMYRVAKRLPDIGKFALANQIRRAAVSLTNNIAEGHGRFHYLDQVKFMFQSRGSLQELIDDLNVCEDEEYWPSDKISSLRAEGCRLRQLVDGYVRYLRSAKSESPSPSVREDPFADEFIDFDHDETRVAT